MCRQSFQRMDSGLRSIQSPWDCWTIDGCAEVEYQQTMGRTDCASSDLGFVKKRSLLIAMAEGREHTPFFWGPQEWPDHTDHDLVKMNIYVMYTV